MGYKPDYGLKLLKDSVSKDTDINFSQFAMYSITVLEYQLYSTMVEIPYNDEIYALSVDFDEVQLMEMLKFAPTETQEQIFNELENDASSQRTFDLENPFYVDITIRLGELQQNQYEAFVPFVLHKIN